MVAWESRGLRRRTAVSEDDSEDRNGNVAQQASIIEDVLIRCYIMQCHAMSRGLMIKQFDSLPRASSTLHADVQMIPEKDS